jgi:hypothetical protein
MPEPAAVIEALEYHLYGLHFEWDYVPAGPVMVPAAALRRIGEACSRILELLKSAASTLGADLVQRHEALGMDSALISLYGDPRFEEAFAAAFARPDIIWSAEGWRIVEFNVSSALGGQQYIHVMARAWGELFGEPMTTFRHANDPLRARRRLVERVCRQWGIEPRVAVVGSSEEIIMPTSRYYDIEVQQLRAAGFEAAYFEWSEFVADLEANAKQFPLAIQRFVAQDWVDAGRDIKPLVDIRSSDCLMLSPHSAHQLANKRLLAILSSGPEWLSQDDRALVDEFIPWTREVHDVPVEYGGRRESLPELLTSRQERFVLKPSDKNSGRDVLLGHEAAPQAWAATLETALAAGSWVVQEFVRPSRLEVPLVDVARGDLEVHRLPAVISPYIIGGEFAGGMVRYDRLGADSVINIGQPGVLLTSLGAR